MAKPRSTTPELEPLRQRIDRWRSTRSGRSRSPMPEPLWAEAASLANQLGVSRVATALGLGYYSLQQRAQHLPAPLGAPGFVELSGAQLLPPASAGAVIEVSSPDGARLTLRLPPGAAVDVADLILRFQKGRP